MSQKGFSSIIFLFIAIAMGAVMVGVILMANPKSKQAVSREEVSPTNTPSTETDQWKTYTNTKYGYSFKYPSEFQIAKGPAGSLPDRALEDWDSVSFESASRGRIDVSVNPKDASGDQFQCATDSECLQKWLEMLKITPPDEVILNLTAQILGKERKGFEHIVKNKLYTQGFNDFVFVENGRVWNIGLPGKDEQKKTGSEKIYDQILSTFRFTDEVISNPTLPAKSSAKQLAYALPSGWKTIQDPTGTFEVGYDPETSHPRTDGVSDLYVSILTNNSDSSKYGVGLSEYNGGSRHTFIWVGGKPDDTYPDYQEKEYTYNKWSCLVIYGATMSQSLPTNGMCAINGTKAFRIGNRSTDVNATEQIIQTIRLLK